eukprot:scaffold7359_cov255-Pinguiococcus_pyrenoidosus.AAC.12
MELKHRREATDLSTSLMSPLRAANKRGCGKNGWWSAADSLAMEVPATGDRAAGGHGVGRAWEEAKNNAGTPDTKRNPYRFRFRFRFLRTFVSLKQGGDLPHIHVSTTQDDAHIPTIGKLLVKRVRQRRRHADRGARLDTHLQAPPH